MSNFSGYGRVASKHRRKQSLGTIPDFVADEPLLETREEQPTLFVAPGNHLVFADLTICEKYRWMPR